LTQWWRGHLVKRFQANNPVTITLLQSDELWIVASFERGALERIRPGQRASVHAAGTIFAARVDSIAPADGQILLEFVESAVQPGAVPALKKLTQRWSDR